LATVLRRASFHVLSVRRIWFAHALLRTMNNAVHLGRFVGIDARDWFSVT
jgi:hypothetical protein